jgi:hypothetical protein
MAKIDGICGDVCNATEFAAIVTMGDDGPYVVGNWGDYMRAIGIEGDILAFPAGRYLSFPEIISARIHGAVRPGLG